MASIGQIKKELEKLETLEEKRAYLEKLLKEVEDENLKKEIEKLLQEVLKHLAHERKFVPAEELEKKLAEGPEIEEVKEIKEEAPKGFEVLETIKYVPKEEAEKESELEKAASAAEPAAAQKRPTYEVPSVAQYESRQEALQSLQLYLKRHMGLEDFTPKAWENLEKRTQEAIFEKAKKALGVEEVRTFEDYSKVMSYVINPLFKREEKYKLNS